MLLTLWLSFHDWSTQTGFETARFVGLANFAEIFGPHSVGRDFKACPRQHGALHGCFRWLLILPLSVALGLLVHQRGVAGGNVPAHRAVLDLHGADDRGARWSGRSSIRRPRGRSTRCSAWVGIGRSPGCPSPEHGADFDRAAECLAAGRLFHRARRCRADPDPRHALRGGDASTAPIACQQFLQHHAAAAAATRCCSAR